jgi:phosphonate transport system substrate-binding protein
MKKLFLFVSLLVVMSMALTACGGAATPEPTEPPVATEAPTEAPTEVPTPTEPPAPSLGTPENPIIMALAPSANTQELVAGGEAIAAKLSELTGYTIEVTVPTNYAALIEAMGSGNAHIGWLPTVPYIVAYEKGYATVGLVTLRSGADHYAFQFVVNQARIDAGDFVSYYDAATSANTADAATALAQFANTRPCYTDPLSSSGYLVPAGYLASLGISTKAGAWVQGHPTVIKSIYLSENGEICDFGTTYVDARTAVTNDFPDVNDKVAIVFVSDPIIPNDTVSFIAGLDPAIRQNLVDALLEIASTEEGIQLLKDGGYSIGGLAPVDDSFYDEFRVYLESINFDINSYR